MISKTTRIVYTWIMLIIIAVIPGCAGKDISVQTPPPEKVLGECVVLIHGMGRTLDSMDEMQQALSNAGYHTVNVNYPSTEEDIETIASTKIPPALKHCMAFDPTSIHFVTHSLGGIILRLMIQNNRPDNLGRVVMLSPPNHGSEVVDEIKDWWIYEWLMGPAGQQLSTRPDSLPQRLGGVDYPVGIITGNQNSIFDIWFAHLIPGEDDGKVSIESAKLKGMKEFLVVEESHPFIMNSDYIQEETIHFLKNEKFMRTIEASPQK